MRSYEKYNDKALRPILQDIVNSCEENNIDIFNKKALYIYVREMTDSSTPQITRTIKKLKKIYKEQYNHYYTHGYVKTN